ncbi:Origin recognition complex subunit 4 [Orchesella cincta]|uniref:Origin recognition complex subunit 4 n=1 Tax=Orchesella cincta TaxID=48709 RepID=A0A1D2MDV2_ORCCI|nr:Origin recognition complex subunit 4 [Orchesella cincta]
MESLESTMEVVRQKLVPIRRTGWEQKCILSLGYETEEEYLKSVIKQVVIGNSDGVKVSTSIMVYGPPGCGKSQLVDKAVKFHLKDHSRTMDVVRLEGVYCFSLQDSVMELCNQIVDDNTLLDGLGQDDTTPFDERLEGILSYLRNKLIDTKKSLVIIIDGMEKFTDDSSQRLLYNLFDISANAVFSVPICIIGITTCVDILDSFEKRVRSRFSHRQINLTPKIEFSAYQEWAMQLLSHVTDKKWNLQTKAVCENKDVIKILRSLFEADRCIGQLKRLLYTASLMWNDVITPESIKNAYTQLFAMQCHVLMAMDLPVSELVVLLGIYKKIQRSQQAWQPAEIFEIIKKPYASFQLRKDDFIKTIIKLQDVEIIVPVGGSQQNRCVSNLNESYYKCEISFVEFQEIWKNYPNLPSFFNEYL